ncbi:MAG: BREX-1 system adenine-specific DNA-methyltransferase PglX [Anaerolineae bacterium]|nr:BREX-1 system adenine-specific DNA-methyltransferase PglX [Anaerolineae bacterium]
MAKAVTHKAHDWLSLVALSGLLVSEPVLQTTFPDGPEKVPAETYRILRKEWERYLVRRDSNQEDAQNRWFRIVLEDLLAYDTDAVHRHPDIPPELHVHLAEYSQVLKPSVVLMDEEEQPHLLITFWPPSQGLDRPEVQTGKWRASPFSKLDRLLRETKVPLGLVSNGEDFRLVYAAPGLATTHITWSAQTWMDEKPTVDAFLTLLGNASFFAEDEERRILHLVQESQRRQVDVADQLGEQVRLALEAFIRALDISDRAAGGELLKGLDHDYIYEMALTLMMRLVFLIYAEENGLLPHGDVLYDQGYGVTHLWYQLEQDMRASLDTLSTIYDGWSRLLATFRLIHEGCEHPDFNLRPYGGRLFDPSRFPLLENPRLRVDNETLSRILRHMLYARAKYGRTYIPQRVSYQTLDVEQLGSVYESLIDYTVERAPEETPLLVFKGKEQPIRPLSEVESLSDEELIAYIATNTGSSKAAVKKKLEKTLAEESAREGSSAASNNENDSVAEEVADYATETPPELKHIAPFLLATTGIIEPGSLYLVKEGGVRKGMGSYYTPRWITSFMVERVLEPLVYEGECENRRVKAPEEILSLKVCDPAMGSGAFLVQACRYLGEALVESWDWIVAEEGEGKVLILPYGRLSRGEPEELIMPADRDEAVAWAQRFVAEKCLYGVDINHLAVDLAKMSLWLATLAKDRPFTFLDHKLKCGNSVVGAWSKDIEKYPIAAWKRDNAATEVKKALKPIERLCLEEQERRDMGTLRLIIIDTEQTLEKGMQAIQTVDSVSTFNPLEKDRLYHEMFLENEEYQRTKTAFDAWCALWFWPVSGDTLPDEVPSIDTYDDFLNHILKDEPSAFVSEKRLKSWTEICVSLAHLEHFFHWEIEFPDVFHKSRGGFDAVVSNPPYVRQEMLRPYKHYFKDVYDVSKGTVDLFAYFYERGVRVLRPEGRLCFISSSTYTKTGSGEGLRVFLSQETSIQEFVDFGDLPVFEGVTTYPAVIVVQAEKPENNHKVRALEVTDLSDTDLAAQLKTVGILVPQDELDPSGWRFEDREVARLREKIIAAGIPLKEYCGGEIFRGILTGLNEAFVVDRGTRDRLIEEDPRSEEVLKPFVEGKDIKPWRLEPRDLWLICIPNGWARTKMGTLESEKDAWDWLQKELPSIAHHLSPYSERLRARSDQGDYFWELRACDYYEAFEKPKIMWPEMSGFPKFCRDEGNFYPNKTSFILPIIDDYLLAFLNTRTCWFMVEGLSPSVRGGYRLLQAIHTERIPVPVVNKGAREDVVELASGILNATEVDSSLLEKLETAFYQILELTSDEIEIIRSSGCR